MPRTEAEVAWTPSLDILLGSQERLSTLFCTLALALSSTNVFWSPNSTHTVIWPKEWITSGGHKDAKYLKSIRRKSSAPSDWSLTPSHKPHRRNKGQELKQCPSLPQESPEPGLCASSQVSPSALSPFLLRQNGTGHFCYSW